MRTQKARTAFIIVGVLAGWGSLVFAQEAATLINEGDSPPATTFEGNNSGWRFTVNREITITHLGILDLGDPGLSQTHIVGLWKNPRSGFVPICSVEISGQVGELIGCYRYVPLVPPITLTPDTAPPLHHTDGFDYIDRYILGVWSPPGSSDSIRITDPGVVSVTDAIWLGGTPPPGFPYNFPPNFTAQIWKPQTVPPYSGLLPPWGQVSDNEHFGVNFRYTVPGPQPEAGPDVTIYTSEQVLTVIAGTATHTNPGTAMTYQWLEGDTVLQSSTEVSVLGTANLSLAAPVPSLSIGSHTLTLEVTDGVYTASDTMTLTLTNTPPEAVPVTGHVLEIGRDAIVIQGSVTDFDGDTVTYRWLKDGQELQSGSLGTQAGGGEVALPDLIIPAGDPRFPLGVNQIQLEVCDNVNPAESAAATVQMIDTTAPTVTPTASALMLWPPNHQFIPITIWLNSEDNGGGALVLTPNVACSEDDGGTDPDWYVDAVDSASGTIALRLRAERSGTGEGRVYAVTITATDVSGNQSVATVDIRVPHDKRKK